MPRNRIIVPDTIVIHYSATPVEKDFSVGDIDAMHRQRGFNKIGYHFYITKDGTVHKGRDTVERGVEMGAHVKGHNDHTIGICYEGGVTLAQPHTGRDTRTLEQTAAMVDLIKQLQRQYHIKMIVGHRDLGSTQCPGFDVKSWWASVTAPPAAQPELTLVERIIQWLTSILSRGR